MAPFHGARPGYEDSRALSFLVQDAGTVAANGIYVRVDSKSVGTDVFVKSGTQYAILKRSENHWSIADLGGGAPGRWNLRSVELYRNDRVPGGFTPPDFGWKVADGHSPSPMVFASKNPNMRLALPKLSQSKSAPTLALALATKKKPLDNLSLTATFTGKGDTSSSRSGPPATNLPLFGSSDSVLEHGKVPGVRGHVNYMLCYSVVLSRPSVKVGWGFKWYERAFQDSGVRDVESVEPDSPLHRWNTWQSIRGRPTAVVFPGDRLLRVDGRWQFPELEIGNDELEADSEVLQRRTINDDNSKAGKRCNSMVFDFARKDEVRPLPPPAPMVEVPESDGADALLKVSWGPPETWNRWQPPVVGWAVILQDIAVRMWHTIDAYGSARPRHGAQSIRAIYGERDSVTVVRGLKQGRAYCACVAVCTEYGGWSAFSPVSRPACLAKPLTIPESVFEDYENPLWAFHSELWPANRIPHYVVPSRVVPGATAPVEVLPVPKTSIPVPNTFMDQRRRLRMQVVMPGNMDGLELGLVDFVIELRRDSNKDENRLGLSFNHEEKVCLIVEYIDSNGLISDWNTANPSEVQLRRNDKIMAVNGVSKDAKRMTEVLKEALTLRMIVVRGEEKKKNKKKMCGVCGQRMGPDGCPKCNKDSVKELNAKNQERTLIVQGIQSGSAADRWNQQMDEHRFTLHGAEVSMGIQVYDKIISLNGVTGAANMINEIQRKPVNCAMIVERIVGHDAEGIDWEIRNVVAELQETVHRLAEARVRDVQEHHDVKEKKDELQRLRLKLMKEAGEVWLPGAQGPDIFEVNSRLDSDAVKLAEEVQWNCLLPPSEGELACTIVSNEMGSLVEAWKDVLRLAREATMTQHNRPPRYTYPAIVGDSESRILLFDRQNQVDNDRKLNLLSPSGSRRSSFSGEPPEEEDHALSSMKAAIVDVRCDPHELRGAISTFDKASPAVKASPAAKKMLRRADTLLQIWTWRERCKEVKERMDKVITEALMVERENTDLADFEDEDSKQYEITHLETIIEEAAEFEAEMQFDYAEAQEILTRHRAENARQTATMKLSRAVKDPREDKENLVEALEDCKKADVHKNIVDAGHEYLTYLEKKHKRDAAREAIRKAVKGLEDKMRKRDKPGAGATEQKIVQEALKEAHLDEEDPLCIEANSLVRKWLTSNSVLRPEAKLFSAVKRAQVGYRESEPQAGDLLGSAIAEVQDAGVAYDRLEEARNTLTDWEFSRKKRATSELEIAMQYGDAEHLKEAITFALEAGFAEDDLRPHKARMERLRYADEIRKMLTEAMEMVDVSALEKCVAFAHGKTFVETEEVLLMSATMQINLRFWTEEFRTAVQNKCAEGLQEDVDRAEELVERCEELLKPGGMDPEPEIATKCLEKDLRSLALQLPTVKDMAAVHSAEHELHRVLGCLEDNAAELPEVIEEAQKQVGAGLSRSLLTEAIDAKKAYDANVADLRESLAKCKEHAGDEMEAENLKNNLIKAFLAGAPGKDVKKAWKILEHQFPELEKYGRIELELLVALAEADDIDDRSVESRFMHLQDAADEARKLNPALIPETWTRVDETSLALAAERTLVMQVASAEIVLSGLRPGTSSGTPGTGSRGASRGTNKGSSNGGSRPGSRQGSSRKKKKRREMDDDHNEKSSGKRKNGSMSMAAQDSTKSGRGSISVKSNTSRKSIRRSLADAMHEMQSPTGAGGGKKDAGISAGANPEQVEELAQKLGNACISAEQCALEEAKKLIPIAVELKDRLKAEAKRRREAQLTLEAATAKRQGITKDLRWALIAAREASLPCSLLEEAYQQLRDMKVAFVSEDMNAALVAGNKTLAVACWFRAQALGYEGLPGLGSKTTMTYQDFFRGEVEAIRTAQSMMRGVRSGGSFGSSSWRNNPQFAVRFSADAHAERLKKAAKEHKHATAIPEITVTVAVAEGAESPANFSVHAVRNSEEACAAGARWLLVPGYEVLACSNPEDDFPLLRFELPPTDDTRPVFLVPSCPRGEEGPFTLVVEGSNPVDVVEVSDKYRELWTHAHDFEIQWADQMPFRKNKGGPRKKGFAPELSWYHNPQFVVRLKSRADVQKELTGKHSRRSDRSALVASFPFAKNGEEDDDDDSDASSKGQTEATSTSLMDTSVAEACTVNITVFGAGDFHDDHIATINDAEVFVTCEIDGREEELFRTQAVHGGSKIEWNYQGQVQDMGSDDMLLFKFWEIAPDLSEVVHSQVDLPYNAFIDGSCSPMVSLGMMTGFDEVQLHRNTKSVFFGKLFLDVCVVQPPTAHSSMFFGSVHDSEAVRPESNGDPFTTAGLAKSPRPSALHRHLEVTSANPHPNLPEAALLQVRLLPVDDKKNEVPVAVHIVKNNYPEESLDENARKRLSSHNSHSPKQEKLEPIEIVSCFDTRRVNENPYYHSVIASSAGADGKEYKCASEVGCVCKLIHGENKEDEGEAVIVIPSLPTKEMDGKFTLQILATEDIIVERLN